MVVMTLVAKSPAGVVALQRYVDGSLSIREKAAMVAFGISEKRTVTCRDPFTVVTLLNLKGLSARAIGGRFDYWASENRKVVSAKMLELGACDSDYYLEVVR